MPSSDADTLLPWGGELLSHQQRVATTITAMLWLHGATELHVGLIYTNCRSKAPPATSVNQIQECCKVLSDLMLHIGLHRALNMMFLPELGLTNVADHLHSTAG